MNPPDLDVPVGRTDNEKEPVDPGIDRESSSNPDDGEEVDEENEFAFLMQPTRWWITSTAFPLLAVRPCLSSEVLED